MTQVSSQLSVAGTDDPIVHPSFVARLAGSFIQLKRSEFDAAIVAERLRITNNTVGIYQQGQRIEIVGEVGYRIWRIGASASLSNANQVVLRPGLIITLANDSNKVFSTTGVPSSVTGSIGDVAVDWNGNTYYTKDGAGWTTLTASIYAASGGSSTPSSYDPPTDDPNNLPVIFNRSNNTVNLTVPISRVFNSGTYHYNVNLNSSGEVVSISAWGPGATGTVFGY